MAQDLYKRGAKVIMLCRNKERADKAAEEIRSKAGQGLERSQDLSHMSRLYMIIIRLSGYSLLFCDNFQLLMTLIKISQT